MRCADNPAVLHVVENLDRGAVENWLARMFRYGTQCGIELRWTFYSELGRAGALESDLKKLGARIVHSPVPIAAKIPFLRALRRELKAGQYDVLHCHHDLISSMYLVASLGLPIRHRIVQVHNSDESVRTANRWKQACLRPVMRKVCLAGADKIVGISQHTLDMFLNGRKRRCGQDMVHYYGVDPSPFVSARGDRESFRRDLGFPKNSLILLFAGRLVPEKNPLFAVKVLAALKRINSRVVGVFVGDGSLLRSMLERVEELELSGSVRFLGWRDDVPEIMTCCDWFILPRPEWPMEGLGLAVIEAQLSGLRLLLSRGISDDPLLPTACVVRLPLEAGPESWARAAIELLRQATPDREAAVDALARSPFDMDFALRELARLHGCAGRGSVGH